MRSSAKKIPPTRNGCGHDNDLFNPNHIDSDIPMSWRAAHQAMMAAFDLIRLDMAMEKVSEAASCPDCGHPAVKGSDGFAYCVECETYFRIPD